MSHEQVDVEIYEGASYSYWDAYLAPRPGQMKLTTQGRQRISQILNYMADMVQFDIGAERPNGNPKSSGVTGPLSGYPTPTTLQMVPRGCQTLIWLHVRPLNWLRTSASDDAVRLWSEHNNGCNASQCKFIQNMRLMTGRVALVSCLSINWSGAFRFPTL
jgi:hypothetical protein